MKTQKKVLVWLARPKGQDLEVALFRVIDARGGGWHPITGGVDAGEELLKAARRELKEETGAQLSQLRHEWLVLERSQSYVGRHGPAEEHAFGLVMDDPYFEPSLDPSEHTDFKWVMVDEAEQFLEHDFHKETLWDMVGAWERKSRFLVDLEWDRFITLASEFAKTEQGQARVLNLFRSTAWFKDIARATEEQAKVQELQPLLEKQALWGALDSLPDVAEILGAIARGSIVEAHPIADVRNWLLALDSWVQFPRESAGRYLKETLLKIYDPFELLKIVNKIISPSGEILENATVRLSGICSKIREAEKELGTRTESLLRQYSDQGILQEKFHDTRSGRVVFPVRVSDQSKINGRVIEFSVSRATAYVEPAELDAAQQKLRGLWSERSQEEYEILTALCKQIQPHAVSISDSIELITIWDAIYAKAKMGQVYGGRSINIHQERKFSLKETAHPILFWTMLPEQIIRNTIQFSPEQAMILISGPNTGGKTVFLKTMALAAICARAGFPFPGVESVDVPFFENIFVDLGDPQSIEEHVSSFSGHVIRMRTILKEFGPHDLVVLDELNSATDPEEGAALCQAFLDELLERCSVAGPSGGYSMIAATTHDPRLKVLAAKNPQVLNASIHFNEKTMMPTYRLVYGAPGRSRALETARRLGIQESVLEKAKGYLSDEHLRTESILKQMEDELGQVESSRREANRMRDEAARHEREWNEKIKGELGSSIEKTRLKLKQVLDLAQMEMREALKKLANVKTMKQVEEIRAELSTATVKAEERLNLESPDEIKVAITDFEVGQWVRVPKWKNIGEIIEWDGSRAKVALGTQRGGGMASAFAVTVFPVEMEKLSDLELKQIPGLKNKVKSGAKATIKMEEVAVQPEIDLRGKRLDDAMSEVETYLDRAYRSGRGEILVIHGLGTGAIREGVRAYLKKLPYVAEISDGGSGSSPGGATRVRFKV